MARIAGVDLPKEKRIEIALTYVYGIGRTLSQEILGETGISLDTRAKDLTDSEVSKLNAVISSKCRVEGNLRRETQQNIRRLIDIGSYRGMRHRRNLPVRGQRTKTNARVRRGRRKTVGAVRAAKKPPSELAPRTELAPKTTATE